MIVTTASTPVFTVSASFAVGKLFHSCPGRLALKLLTGCRA